MEDMPTSMLAQQAAARPVSSIDLEVFGKSAASKYHSGLCSTMTEAVVGAVKTAGLSPEQVRRVVEFANQTAYLTEFKKEGSHHKVVNLSGGPADPSEVLKDLNDGGGGTVFDPGTGDYSTPPSSMGKLASRNADRMGVEAVKTAAIFNPDQPVDTKDIAYPYADPLREAHDALGVARSIDKEAQSELNSELYVFQATCDELFQQVKQAAMNGTTLAQIVSAWGQACPDTDEGLMKSAFAVLTPRLLDNGVFRSKSAISDSLMDKMASASTQVVNPAHSLPQVYKAFCESATKLAALQSVQNDAKEASRQLGSFLEVVIKTGSAGSAVGHFAGKTVPRAWKATRDLAAKGGEGTRKFVETAVREGGGKADTANRAGRIVGGAVKYSPHIAAGIAAEEGYQRTKLNPTVQSAKNFVLSRVPHTEQNLIRQARIYRG